jgi:hypothetical protein
MMCCRGLRAERSALFPRHASRGLPCSFAVKVTWDIEDRKPPSLFRMGLKIRLNENLHCFLAGVHFDTNRSTAEINLGEIERAIAAFAQSSNSGLIVTGAPGAVLHRELIIALAARHRLPAVYNGRYYVTGGGLMSYGPDFVDQLRRAAGYVDRILKGEKPADLPVQAPTKYELVINLKTAFRGRS